MPDIMVLNCCTESVCFDEAQRVVTTPPWICPVAVRSVTGEVYCHLDRGENNLCNLLSVLGYSKGYSTAIACDKSQASLVILVPLSMRCSLNYITFK